MLRTIVGRAPSPNSYEDHATHENLRLSLWILGRGECGPVRVRDHRFGSVASGQGATVQRSDQFRHVSATDSTRLVECLDHANGGIEHGPGAPSRLRDGGIHDPRV